MPPRPGIFATRLSVCDLPVLPFLAPRAFTPWPRCCRGRRNLSTLENASATSDVIQDSRLHDVADKAHTRSTQRRDADLAAMTKIVESMDAGLYNTGPNERFQSSQTSVETMGNSLLSSGMKSRRASRKKAGHEPPRIDDFKIVYDEIWGSRKTVVKPSSETARIPSNRAKATVSQPEESFADDAREQVAISNTRKTLESPGDLEYTQMQQTTPKIQTRGQVRHRKIPTASRHLMRMKVLRPLQVHSKPQKTRASDFYLKERNPELWAALRRQKILDNAEIRRVATERASGYFPKSVNRWRQLDLNRTSPLQPLADYSDYWSTEFASLSLRFDNHLHKTSRLKLFLAVRCYDPDAHEISDRLSNIDSSQEIRKEWLQYSPQEREALWANVLLRTLQKYPMSALRVLIATYVPPYGPSHVVSDSLEYIFSYYLMGRPKVSEHTIEALLEASRHLLEVEDGNVGLTQRSMYLLLSRLKENGAVYFFNLLRNHAIEMHENTLLQFVSILARDGKTKTAIEALRCLHDKGTDFTKPKIESVCAILLQKKFQDPDANHSDSEVFSTLLNLGLRPNIIFYNVLLQNAVTCGDHRTGWQIHDMMLENAIEPDAHTYSILLNDAKHRMDWDSVSHIQEVTVSKGIMNPYIATDLLHALFLQSEEGSQAAGQRRTREVKSPFKRMIQLYSRYFDMAPLLAVYPMNEEHYKDYIQHPHGVLMTPTKETLVVMLIARLRGVSQNTPSTLRFYNNFRRLVHEGHPAVAALVSTTHIYDAVIMSFGNNPKYLPYCTKVIGDMIALSTPPPQHGELASKHHKTDRDPGATKSSSAFPEMMQDTVQSAVSHVHNYRNHAPPSVYTWSILLKAFIQNEQPRAAEKVLSMMQSRGIPANRVTWNSLTLGYARLQDVSGTVHAMERAENEGWAPDDVTMKSLSWIKNRQGLVDALRQSRERKEAKREALGFAPGKARFYKEGLERTDEIAAGEVDRLAEAVDVAHRSTGDIVRKTEIGSEKTKRGRRQLRNKGPSPISLASIQV